MTARITERFSTGVSLLYETDSVLDAKETIGAWLQTTENLK